VFADRLIVGKFSFPSSLILLALVIGSGFAYLGWQWDLPLSNRSRLGRLFILFFCVGLLLTAAWLLDRSLLSVLSDSTHMVVYQVPGVYIESAPGIRRLSIESNLPPYWLAVLVYGGLAAIAGHLISRSRERLSK
jgi:hypothetical protein